MLRSESSPVSRVREIRMHGLKGGPVPLLARCNSGTGSTKAPPPVGRTRETAGPADREGTHFRVSEVQAKQSHHA